MRLPTVAQAMPRLPLNRMLQLPGSHSETVRRRLRVLADALGLSGSVDSATGTLLAALERRLGAADPEEMWLTLAVLGARLPEEPDVVRAVRISRLEGPRAVLNDALRGSWTRRLLGFEEVAEVEVVTGQILVDLEHTSRTELATGIQRVARMVTGRWVQNHDLTLVGWTSDHRALRRLRSHERVRALTGRTDGSEAAGGDGPDTVIVPWQATYLVPELGLERERTRRMLAMVRYSRSRTGIIGHDCVPVSSAETTNVWVSEGYTNYLAAVRYMDRVAAVSQASAREFRGWRRMLSAIGVHGPEITAIGLPSEANEPSEENLAEAGERLLVGSLPLVLCVGAHEPRKNHLAVLHAAEVLWRRGLRFSLAFIGGNSWNSQRFEEHVDKLRANGRPIDTLFSVTDDMLWAAYRIAHCVVFPSLNEGYGLPVAEALSCGTPVVTSNFGSMAEIAAGGGAVLVDPRDDTSLTEGLGRILSDDALHARLRAEAEARPQRTWDDYARETWSLLVDEGETRP